MHGSVEGHNAGVDLVFWEDTLFTVAIAPLPGYATYAYTPPKAEKSPSTGTTIPVTKDEAGLTSQSKASPESSGTPKRP